LPAIYSAANLFLLPSRHENFGNVVVEALACGCPVVISDKVGLHDEVSDGGVGWVLPRVEALWTESITKLIQFRSTITEAVSVSVEYVDSTYSIKKTSLQMTTNYLQTIDKYHTKSEHG